MLPPRCVVPLLVLLSLLGLTVSVSAQSTTSTTTTTIALPTVVPFSQSNRNSMIGTYTPVSGCVPSATCCCSTGPVTVAAGNTNTQLTLAGTTDGGQGCMSMTTLSGVFEMDSPTSAYSYLSFIPLLVQLRADPTYNQLQMNTTKTTCVNQFQRSASTPSTPSTPVNTSTNPLPNLNSTLPPLGSSGGSVSLPPVNSTGTNAFPLPPNPFNNTGSGNAQQFPSIPPISTTTPFNTQLPNLTPPTGSPFDTSALQAVPIGSTPQLPPIGSNLPPANLPQLPGNNMNTTATPTLPNSPFPNNNNNANTGSVTAQSTDATSSTSTTSTSSNNNNNNPLPPLPGSTTSTSTNNGPNLPSPFNTTSSTANTNTNSNTNLNLPVTFTPLLVEASNSNATANTKNYYASFIVPASSNVKNVILHYYTMADMRQKNVYMNRSSSATLQQRLFSAASTSSPIPLNASTLPNSNPNQQYAVWLHGPINVASNDVLTYSYTYSGSADGSNAFNTASYFYPSPLMPVAAAVAIPADAFDSSANPSNPSDSAWLSLWQGSFQADSSCVPSESCCCAVGLLNVSSSLDAPGQVQLQAALDGGAGCLYQSSLSGLMAINASNPRQATRQIQIPNAESTVITFTAQIDTPVAANGQQGEPDSKLTISNSFRPCPTTAFKLASTNPGSGNDTQSEQDPDPTNHSTNPLPRDAFVGDYDFDESCVPSASCCCAQGLLSIAPVTAATARPAVPAALASLAQPNNNTNFNYSNEILLSANLDGGSACMGMQNVAQIFNLTSPHIASFSFPPVALSAALSSSSNSNTNLDTVTFTNSLYPTCLSVAKRRASTNPNNNSSNPNTNPNTPQGPLLSSMSAEQIAALRDQYVGDYSSGESCVPSAGCCCATGITRIRPNSTSPYLVDVDTELTGQGFSCLQKDGPAHMTFSLLNTTAAEATFFAPVKFTAAMQSDNKTVVVSNTVHPQCPTTLTKMNNVAQSGAESKMAINSIILYISLLIATITLLWR